MKCILNVTDHEYDRILQLNHDSLIVSTADVHLVAALREMLGTETAAELCKYDECRVEKNETLANRPRIALPSVSAEPQPKSVVKHQPELLTGANARGQVPACPTGLSDQEMI